MPQRCKGHTGLLSPGDLLQGWSTGHGVPAPSHGCSPDFRKGPHRWRLLGGHVSSCGARGLCVGHRAASCGCQLLCC